MQLVLNLLDVEIHFFEKIQGSIISRISQANIFYLYRTVDLKSYGFWSLNQNPDYPRILTSGIKIYIDIKTLVSPLRSYKLA